VLWRSSHPGSKHRFLPPGIRRLAVKFSAAQVVVPFEFHRLRWGHPERSCSSGISRGTKQLRGRSLASRVQARGVGMTPIAGTELKLSHYVPPPISGNRPCLAQVRALTQATRDVRLISFCSPHCSRSISTPHGSDAASTRRITARCSAHRNSAGVAVWHLHDRGAQAAAARSGGAAGQDRRRGGEVSRRHCSSRGTHGCERREPPCSARKKSGAGQRSKPAPTR